MKPDDVRRLAKFDQALSLFNEAVTPMLFSFFKNCMDQGFSEVQALMLTRDLLKATFSRAKNEESDKDGH